MPAPEGVKPGRSGIEFFYQAACRSVIAASNLAHIYTKERIIFLRLKCKSLGYGIQLD